MTVADDVDMIDSDELRFKQVVLNLLTNAVKFTPDGGSVTDPRIRDGTELVVTVTDTGIGVPPEDQERIFESFQQGGGARQGGGHWSRADAVPTNRRAVRGSDVARQRARLTAARSASRSRPARAGPRRPPRSARAELPVIVVVDDDRASLDLFSAYLDGSPAQVLRARDGVEALELIRKVLPAVVVLDVRLPGLDGWQVLAELKADTATADHPGGRRLGRRRSGPRLVPSARRRICTSRYARDELVDALRRVGALPIGIRPRVRGVMTPRRILVVEDNPLNLKLVRDVLQVSGYHVVEAHSGEEGLHAAARTDPPDLVLMDLQLPGIDGFETLRRLRQGSLGIGRTGRRGHRVRDGRGPDSRASLAGFDGYVEKPISVRALPGQVDAF